MTTRAGLRSTIRAELNDSGGTQLWTDALLNEWIAEAIRAYSRDLPKESSTTLTSVADQADYSLPSDCLRVVRVEHPAGFFRIPDPLSAGDVLDELSAVGCQLSGQLAYEVWGSYGSLTLSLRPAPSANGESIVVRYLASWAEPASDGALLATPGIDDQLLVWWVCWAALAWLSTDESKRQRYERQRGADTLDAAGAYLGRFRSEIVGRGSRVAARRLVVRQ